MKNVSKSALKAAKPVNLKISVERQNAADWQYAKALWHWGQYEKLLDSRGLLHPNDLGKARYHQKEYAYHTQQGDYLLHKGPKVRRRHSGRVNTKNFANDFEKALAQRGEMAHPAHIKELASRSEGMIH